MDLSAQVAHELLARIIIYNIEKTIMKHEKLICVVEGAARGSFSQPFLTPPIPFSLRVRCLYLPSLPLPSHSLLLFDSIPLFSHLFSQSHPFHYY